MSKVNKTYAGWHVLGTYASDDAYRVVFRHKKWIVSRFVVVKLFIGKQTFTVKFWSGSLQKTASFWNTKPVESLPDDVVADAFGKLQQICGWVREATNAGEKSSSHEQA